MKNNSSFNVKWSLEALYMSSDESLDAFLWVWLVELLIDHTTSY